MARCRFPVRSLLVFGLGAIAVAACGRPEAATAPQAATPASAPAAKSAAEREPAVVGALRFIEDDYERARAEAVRRGVPLFADVWASWCHTCLSMKQYVLPEPGLARLADSFVWLSIDSERASNRAFLERFSTRSLPTLWVIDPASQEPLLKWIGAATGDELAAVLDDAKQEAANPSGEAGRDAEANALWLRGNRASAAGRAEQAADAYRSALALASESWTKRPRVLEALAMRLAELERHADSVALAAREAARMPAGTSRLNVVLLGLDAAGELPAGDTARTATLAALIALGERIAADASASVLVDDRSSLYASLVTLLRESDPDRSRRLAADWAALLEAQAARAPTPAARRVWDPHRVEAYLALDAPARAIPVLEQSEREAPADFNPPARLARAYLSAKRLPEARAAIDRALGRCAGPRKLRLYLLKADVLLAAGDRAAARGALEEALVFARDAALPSQYDRLRETIERRARELS